uniref:Replication initiator protein n=1 Tax=Dulem virus 169 TaxID=3145646 RepID=A0AAU8AWB6_9VIRU
MCNHPLKGFQVGFTDSGKPKYKIVSFDVDHVEIDITGHLTVCMEKFTGANCSDRVDNYIEIPCGKCIECRLEYSRQWANRCMLELQYHDPRFCWFVTLTYDDMSMQHLPVGLINDCEVHSVDKQDIQKFFKLLRRDVEYHDRAVEPSIRYFCCGEYGSKSLRPHYHAIIYGLNLSDNTSWSKSHHNFQLFRSPYLEKIWKKGFVVVSPVTWETCAYTARYVMKKAKGLTADQYLEHGINPEFVLMSRRPGIGRQYFDDHYKDIYKFDSINVSTSQGGKQFKPPRYFDQLYAQIDSLESEVLKINRRECAEAAIELKLKCTDKSYVDVLRTEEKILSSKVKALRRDHI